MPFEYISPQDARERDGLRMVVVGNVPSAWGEAAKGIFHYKKIEWSAVRLDFRDEVLRDWLGELSGPIAIYNDEKPITNWASILLLAERIQPSPTLLGTNAEERALIFGLSHELMGESGLVWSRRLQGIKSSFDGEGGFHEKVAQYLGRRYGYSEATGAAATKRTVELLNMLSARLLKQKDAGSSFYLGQSVSAVDFYSAACMAMFDPLPEEQCKMDPNARASFKIFDDETRNAFHPILLEHRDMMYREFMELPLNL